MQNRLNDKFDANRRLWDARTEIHKASAFYDIPGFLAGKNVLDSIVLDGIGPVQGKSLLHLQCHFGQDTLCFARMGANVTGVDFSEAAIAEARHLTQKTNLEARFVVSNVYNLAQHLDETFDIVFTSYGVLGWLPDLELWAEVVKRYLKPGGLFFIAEFHPVLYLFDFDSRRLRYPYFNPGDAFEETGGTYTDGGEQIVARSYFWQHSLQDVIRPLLQRNLNVVDFQEFDYSPYDCFANMNERTPGKFTFGNFDFSLPHVFSLKCERVRG